MLRGNGPTSQRELLDRTGINRGTIGGVLKRLGEAGKIVRDGERQGTGRPSPIWRLVDDDALADGHGDDEPGDASVNGNAAAASVLENRVREVLAHKRMGAAGVASELNEEVPEVSRAISGLVDRGEVVRDGPVFAAA